MSEWKLGILFALMPIWIPLLFAPSMTIDFVVKLWRTYHGKDD